MSKHNKFSDSSQAVDQFMGELIHPHKIEVVAVRQIVMNADGAIAEGVKWNAPSFRTDEYFATLHLRLKQGVGLILHLGAKARELPVGGLSIDDPQQLLKWLSQDRAMVVFLNLADIERKRSALTKVLQQWIRYV